jgi:hypothetical protein
MSWHRGCVNHAMGRDDLYPFTISEAVQTKLDFVQRVVQDVAMPANRYSPARRAPIRSDLRAGTALHHPP